MSVNVSSTSFSIDVTTLVTGFEPGLLALGNITIGKIVSQVHGHKRASVTSITAIHLCDRLCSNRR
jgi:hypothetical protein